MHKKCNKFVINKLKMTKGELLTKALEETKYPIGALATKIKKGRRTIYNWMEGDAIPLETLLLIGKVIRYDFSLEIPELKDMASLFARAEDLEYKEKYYDLLEDYASLAMEFKEKYEKLPKGNEKKNAPSASTAPKVRQVTKKK